MDEFNRELVDLTHPEPYTQPTPEGPYNLVVVGAGTAGLVAAAGAAGLGAKVALIERHFLGGDCLNYGCVPSKGLIRCATALADVRDAGDYHVQTQGDPDVDFGGVMERMRRLRTRISHNDSVERFTGLGIDVYLGDATFTGAQTLEVEGQTLTFSKAVIATGARASAPPIPGLDEVPYLTNETLFNLTELPKRLAVIGGGPIGSEMSQSFQRFGSEVHLLEKADRILNKEQPEASQFVQKALEKDGVDLVLGMESIDQVRSSGGEIQIEISLKSGEKKTLTVDALLVAVGRAPNVDGLGLETAGVEYDLRRGVTVDDRLRTSNSRIFAAGDVASNYKFTHAADFMARQVLANALFLGRRKTSDLVIPWATYTDPQIAHVGITPETAAAEGLEIDTYTQSFEEVDRAILDGDDASGLAVIHTAKGKDRILGGTIVARHAGDMIGEIVMAMNHGIGLGSVANVIHPYPTQAEAIRKLGDQYNRTRLTPTVAQWMKRWLDWRRGK